MIPIDNFDPSIGSGTIHTKGINNDEQLVLYNDSLYGMTLVFGDRTTDQIPPQWSKDFIKANIPMGDIQWSVFVTITATGYPISLCYGTLYEENEHIPSINAGMQRGFQITGGTVGSVTVAADHIVNDGNVAGTSVIEVTPSGGGSVAVLDNSANAVLKSLTTTGNNTLGGSTGLGIVSVGGGLTFTGGNLVLGGHTVSGPMSLTGGFGLTSGDANFNGHQVQNVSLLTFNGNGSLSSTGFATGTGSGTFTHTLGVTPSWVGLSPHFVGSMTIGYDSETSTNMHVTAGAVQAWTAWVERN